MDPLTVLGLVANVVSLVEFTAELASQTKDLIESSTGALPKNETVENFAQHNKELTSELTKSTNHNKNGTKAETALGKLALRCSEESTALISVLDKLKVPTRQDGSRSKFKAVQATLKTMLKDGVIQERQRKLESLERQLCTILLCVLRDSQATEFGSLKQLVRLSGSEPVAAVHDAKDKLLAELQSLRTVIEGRFDRVEKILMDAEDERRAKVLIESLKYTEMLHREGAISERHGETFSWIFDQTDANVQDGRQRDQKPSLRDWFMNETGIFWIVGNPAAGKSTLMKYLYTSERIYDLLDIWAKGQRILIAAHYFWVAGSLVERSEHGMLRHLCHSLLSSDPRLVQVACPERCKTGRLSAEWSNEQLRKVLQNLADIPNYSMCLFVDGLDESENDKCAEVVIYLKSLASHQNVKICLTSRPWTVFERSLAGLPRLQLHDKIWHDIFELVCHRLQETMPQIFDGEVCNEMLFAEINAHEWRKIEDRGPGPQLIRDIVEKASGNFLWAKLVLSTICTRLLHGSDITSVKLYVEQSPQEMNEYLEEFVFDRIHSSYRVGRYSETAMALRIALVDQQFTLFVSFRWVWFWTLLESKRKGGGMIFDPEFGVSQAYLHFDDLDERRMLEDTSAYLHGCCQDLLICSWEDRDDRYDRRVTFQHRSISDFLNNPRQRIKLDEDTPEHFRRAVGAQLCLMLSKITFESEHACHTVGLSLRLALEYAEEVSLPQTFLTSCEKGTLRHLDGHQRDEYFYSCDLCHDHRTNGNLAHDLWRLGARNFGDQLRDRTLQSMPGGVRMLNDLDIERYQKTFQDFYFLVLPPVGKGIRVRFDDTPSDLAYEAATKLPYFQEGFQPCHASAWIGSLHSMAMDLFVQESGLGDGGELSLGDTEWCSAWLDAGARIDFETCVLPGDCHGMQCGEHCSDEICIGNHGPPPNRNPCRWVDAAEIIKKALPEHYEKEMARRRDQHARITEVTDQDTVEEVEGPVAVELTTRESQMKSVAVQSVERSETETDRTALSEKADLPILPLKSRATF